MIRHFHECTADEQASIRALAAQHGVVSDWAFFGIAHTLTNIYAGFEQDITAKQVCEIALMLEHWKKSKQV